MADLYIILFDAILKNPEEVGHGREGFYFGENGEHTLLNVSAEIGKTLVALGKAKTDEVTSFSDAEMDKYYGGVRPRAPFRPASADRRGSGQLDWIGPNSRCRAERSRKLGWKPTKGTEEMLKSIRPETEVILASGKIEFVGKI